MPTGAPFENPSQQLETPSDAVLSPTPDAPRAQPYIGSRWSSGLSALSSFSKSIANPIDTPLKKALVFGGMALVSIIALLVVLARTAWAHPQIVPSEAEELYKQGLRLFGSGDYEGAKVNFAEAANQAPAAPEPKRYAGLCDIEIRAHALLKSADRALTAHQYGEAMKALSQIDSSSIASPDAAELRRQTAPKAAAQDVDEAQRLALDDPDGARAKLKEALTFDPNSADARALVARIKSGAAMQAPVVAAKEPEPVHAEEPAPVEHSKHAHHEHEHASDLAPVKIGPSHGGGGSLSGAALTAYRAKDFGGADRAMRIESTHQATKQALKTIELANLIRQLKQTLDRADGEEGKNPGAAARDLGAALSLDAKISRGVHAGWLKARLGRVQLANAQGAFRQGHYDVAYQAVTSAEKLGAGDGGLRRQLETKASELVQRGQSLQRSNVNQAKQYWRMVMHMVPSSSATYAKAYSLLNNAAAKQQDQDED
jgi:tetratricopeptide (TPR) repeat protein